MARSNSHRSNIVTRHAGVLVETPVSVHHMAQQRAKQLAQIEQYRRTHPAVRRQVVQNGHPVRRTTPASNIRVGSALRGNPQALAGLARLKQSL